MVFVFPVQLENTLWEKNRGALTHCFVHTKAMTFVVDAVEVRSVEGRSPSKSSLVILSTANNSGSRKTDGRQNRAREDARDCWHQQYA